MIYFCYLFTAIVLLVTGASSNVITIQANSNGPADPALDLLDPAANHSKWSAAVKSLSALSSEEFTTLQHPTFPSHSVRIKRVDDWCDSTVNVYSGYVDYQARHLFFYFFESRNDVDADPLMMWINGGPGGSSSMGLFMELGPCSIDPENVNKTVWNPYSWNDKASIFFLDQPVGVGFSYSDFGISVSTTEEAAKDIYAFIFVFLEHFESFKGRDLHLSGESYGGRYLPVFASEIVDSNQQAVKAGYEPINLKSTLIGNGWTDFVTQIDSYLEMQCTNASYPAVQSIETCVRLKTTLPRCKAMLQAECVDRFDLIGCQAADEFCGEHLYLYMNLGRNPYDISKTCEDYEETLCYPITKSISAHLNLPEIRAKLGVDDSVVKHVPGSMQVGMAFGMAGDGLHDTSLYVEGLLERGVRVLIYAGDYDFICNWIGNKKWTESFEWTGKKAFVQQQLRPWMVNGKQAGITRAAKGLTYATVHGAGHMVPYDKPVQALAMLNRWLGEKDL